MIIRSQDKKFIYNINNLEAIFVSSYGIDGYCVRIGVNQNSDAIGYYSTEEKAIKVLDMIQDVYTQYGTLEDGLGNIHGVFNIPKCFQMPQDSEV